MRNISHEMECEKKKSRICDTQSWRNKKIGTKATKYTFTTTMKCIVPTAIFSQQT